MQLESPTVNTNKSANQLFDFLMDVKNFESIMPENTETFEVLDQAFIFALKGMPKIKLKLQENEKPSKIVFTSASEQFPFTLTGNIAPVTDTTATINLQFEGDFNAMMAMMIKGPLQKFINTLAENLSKL
ncbi:MAG: SRPBCC family protein [Flavobacteriaceae bacterium]|nr:SRPBCC family protein [Flavobacteriaceae bacterium]